MLDGFGVVTFNLNTETLRQSREVRSSFMAYSRFRLWLQSIKDVDGRLPLHSHRNDF